MISNSLGKSICASCNSTIEGKITLKIEPDILLHSQCLICHQCGGSLVDEDSCFVKFGRIFCYDHYRALFSKSCSICQNTFTNTDLVLPLCRDNYCHASCLLCTVCGKMLTSGCKYTISNWSVVCSDCNIITTLPSLSAISNSSLYSYKSQSPDTSIENIENESGGKHKDPVELKMEKLFDSEDEDELSESECGESDSDMMSQSIKTTSPSKIDRLRKNKKTPRNRTVLSEKQLCTLQTYYQMNPKPDALTKEQLMEVTGLKQRVISVWFQNKRCKEKKRRISEELNKNKSPGMLATAELMLTESPIEYEPQCPEVEIEKIFNDSNRFLKDSNYIKNYFTTMLTDHKSDQSSTNRCNAPLVHSVSKHNQYSNVARLH